MPHTMRGNGSFVAALAVTVAVAGCGGGGGAGEAKFDAGPAEITKPGSVLAVGERAFVEYGGLGAELEPTVNTTLGVTVQKVDEGDSSDIEGLGESTVPYYVHAEYENHGDAAIDVGVVGGHFTIRGSDGEEYDTEGVISIGGEFEPCPGAESQAALAAEQAIADCVVITLAEGVSPQEVRFIGDFAVLDQEPVAWKVD